HPGPHHVGEVPPAPAARPGLPGPLGPARPGPRHRTGAGGAGSGAVRTPPLRRGGEGRRGLLLGVGVGQPCGKVSTAPSARWSLFFTVYARSAFTPIRLSGTTWSMVTFGNGSPLYGHVVTSPSPSTE